MDKIFSKEEKQKMGEMVGFFLLPSFNFWGPPSSCCCHLLFSLLGPSLSNGKLKGFIVRKMGERVGFCREDDLFIFYFFSFFVLCLTLVAEVDQFGVWYGPFPINVFLLKRFYHCLRPGNAL